MSQSPRVRPAVPEDYDRIIAVADEWWERPISSVLPRLHLDHFHRTSLVAEDESGLAGFLVGLISPSAPDAAYIHFVGVAPRIRGTGLGRRLYHRFFELAAAEGRSRVGAVTSPQNRRSIAFHTAMGFTVTGPVPDYDGPGADRVVFQLLLPPR
ncbi:GNAT family N-acetyltransferase [Streptomyces sp. NBC_00820]|uniref:GNAT family N-acetyltransferase n=1 Tax=Streptomyces sp. NBC_00820 TaxID=2975842 RepID=UPI002ED287C1|nr:GNAT family N-acetyltransferase [Streptomyces sp. NBC_00820]